MQKNTTLDLILSIVGLVFVILLGVFFDYLAYLHFFYKFGGGLSGELVHLGIMSIVFVFFWLSFVLTFKYKDNLSNLTFQKIRKITAILFATPVGYYSIYLLVGVVLGFLPNILIFILAFVPVYIIARFTFLKPRQAISQQTPIVPHKKLLLSEPFAISLIVLGLSMFVILCFEPPPRGILFVLFLIFLIFSALLVSLGIISLVIFLKTALSK